jgi:uncharacterized protein YhdP
MPNPILQRSFNFLKISTWLAAIVSLLLLGVVAFFVLFPQIIKATLEDKLYSATGLNFSIERLALEFINNELLLAAHGIDVSAQGLSPIVSIDVFRWNVNLSALIKGVEIPGDININELNVDVNLIESYMSFIDTDAIFSDTGLSGLLALETLFINKTIIRGQNTTHQLAPIKLKRSKQKIILSIENQALITNVQMPKIGNTVDIKTSIDVTRAKEDRVAIFPFTVKNADFSLFAQLKIFSEKGQIFLEFESYIDQIDVAKIQQNIPEVLANTQSAIWLSRSLNSGIIKNAMFTMRFNLSDEHDKPLTKFNADLIDAQLTIDSAWSPITELNVKVSFTNNYVQIIGKDAKIDDIHISYLDILVNNFSQDNAKIIATGHIRSTSEQVAVFIKKSPVSEATKYFFDQFELTGGMRGDFMIEIPFDKDHYKKALLDFDMYVTDNQLNFLEGKIKIDHYSSQISYHNNILQTEGTGDIGGVPFDLSINPDEWIDDNPSAFKVAMKQRDGDLEAFISKEGSSEWHAQINSKDVEVGVYLYPHPKGLTFVELHDLRMADIDEIKSPWNFLPGDFPSFHLISKNAEVDGNPIPNFEADLISKEQVMQIQNLRFEDIGVSDKELIFNGAWLDGKTILRTKASHHNLSDFLERFGIEEPVSGGKFTTDIRLYCDCSPWEISITKISGFIQVDIEEGVFTNQDPSFFKLLSFVNLDSIANRMKLDKNELKEQGFAYDRINVKLLFGDAKASIYDFQIESEDSEIELSGYADLINRDYNLVATVRPSIADSVPLATYLVGGGLTGLGIWAADKLLFGGEIIGKMFNDVLEFNYTITGPWSNPVIKSKGFDS